MEDSGQFHALAALTLEKEHMETTG